MPVHERLASQHGQTVGGHALREKLTQSYGLVGETFGSKVLGKQSK